jgi:hypothetical protein
LPHAPSRKAPFNLEATLHKLCTAALCGIFCALLLSAPLRAGEAVEVETESPRADPAGHHHHGHRGRADLGHAEHAEDSHGAHEEHGHGDHDDHGHDGDGASVNVMGVYGHSSVDDAELEGIQGGGHDPLRSGFTLQQLELALHGDLTEDMHAAAFLVQGEEELEVEEAYLEATSHDSMRLRAGYLYTPFGIHNQRHPHAWQWIDQPVINTRLLGGEGSRGAGARLDFALGHYWDSRFTLALQQADDDTLVSFRGRGHVHGGEDHGHGHGEGEESLVDHLEETYGGLTVGNRPYIESGGLVYGARLSHTWSEGCDTRIQAGLSALYGPNASGPDSDTLLLGVDFSLRWQPCAGQWPFVLWETEVMRREYDAAAVFNADEPDELIDLPAATLTDSGWYTQVLYGFEPQWAAGVRYESADGSGESVDGSAADPLRDDRTRLSPLLTWQSADHRTRVRFQYNFDTAQHLGVLGGSDTAESVWLGVDFTLGRHHHRDDPGLEVPGHAEDGHGDHAGHADHGAHGNSDDMRKHVYSPDETLGEPVVHDHAELEHEDEHDHGHGPTSDSEAKEGPTTPAWQRLLH